VLRNAARQIANPPVRNMGTIGGSIAFADPAADYPPALVAANAEIEIAGKATRRRVAAEAFFTDWYATALGAGELVTAVYLPAPRPGIGLYKKFARVAGDFAIASVAISAARAERSVE
jgi:carbon-monoxide dehydrogenase medium subunit